MCNLCGMEYSFFFNTQFHKKECADNQSENVILDIFSGLEVRDND